MVPLENISRATLSSLLSLFLFGVLVLILFHSPAIGEELAVLQGGVLRIQDFTFYYALVAAFWRNGGHGIYYADEIVRGLEWYVGARPPAAIPNPMSPTAIVVWSPLLLLGERAASSAYLAWMIASFAVVSGAVRAVLARSAYTLAGMLLITCGVILSFLSAIGQNTITLGQTSLFAVGILGFIFHRVCRQAGLKSTSPWEDAALGALLFLASIKLPYFLIGCGMALVARRERSVGIALLIAMGSCLLGMAWGSVSWCAGYPMTLYRYVTNSFSEGGFYWGGFNADTPTWMRASEGLVSDSLRLAVNWLGLSFGAIGLLKAWRMRTEEGDAKKIVLAAKSALGSYLLFSRYLGAYEDMLLLLVPLMTLGRTRTIRSVLQAGFCYIIIFFALSDDIFPPVIRFGCKCLALLF